MEPPNRSADPPRRTELLHRLMRDQLRLSFRCAASFLVLLLGLPLLNYLLPDLMGTNIFGFSLTWLILGLLFFPFVWLISWIFIRRSIALEQREASLIASEPPTDR